MLSVGPVSRNGLNAYMPTQKQIEAWSKNWLNWRGQSPEGRERIRQACLRDKPWERSSGPRTEAGKARCRGNGVTTGAYCTTIEPYASLTRLREAIRGYAKAITQRIMESGDPFPLLGPEADALSAAHRGLCDVLGMTVVEPTDTLGAAGKLLGACAEHPAAITPMALAGCWLDLARTHKAIENAQARLCDRLEAEVIADAESGSLLS